MDEFTDVVVVGAGPAGCAAAGLLAARGRRGLRVGRGEVPHPLLDPILLDGVALQAGAEVRLGWSADELLQRDGVVAGVRARGPNGEHWQVGARLVVAADGRKSRLARSAHLPERCLPNRHAALI